MHAMRKSEQSDNFHESRYFTLLFYNLKEALEKCSNQEISV